MKRFHLFEFEDYDWFPKIIRDGGTDFLGFVLKYIKFYEPSINILEDVVKRSGHHHIVDLCSGNGGPISLVHDKIDKDLQVSYTLSDKFPNRAAYKKLKTTSNGIIDFKSESLDILNDIIITEGIRTLFTAIHHFKPEEVRLILNNAIIDRAPIAIFDGGNKHIGSILAIVLTHPIWFFFGTPFIRPFKWSRLLLTYIIPLIPLYAIWDGIVSILRLHTPEELLGYAHNSDNKQQFTWSAGKVKNKVGFSVAYLVGIPN